MTTPALTSEVIDGYRDLMKPFGCPKGRKINRVLLLTPPSTRDILRI